MGIRFSGSRVCASLRLERLGNVLRSAEIGAGETEDEERRVPSESMRAFLGSPELRLGSKLSEPPEK
jgi:hypothetical protein